MIFAFDVDGTLCEGSEDGDYTTAEPIWSRIREVNRLHDKGHEIVVFTARGDQTGIDWRERTVTQLNRWGLKFDRFEIKPHADIYVDDRNATPEQFFGA